MRGARLAAAGLTALTLIAGCLVTSAPAAAASAAPTPVVQGNALIDSRNGQTFVPRGVNWPGFEYACWQGWGYSGGHSAAEAEAIASWHANTVRIPLNQDCWLGLNGTPKGSGRTAAGYQADVRSWSDQLNAAGLVVVLDLHSSAPAGYTAQGQRAMADAQSLTFWTQVATAYKSAPSVMFDLFNEPYSRWQGSAKVFDMTWSCWKGGGCQAPVEDDYTSTLSGAKFSTVGMDQLVSTVRATGAQQPLLLGGLDYSNDLSGWLSHKPSDSQLIAAWHAYPGQRVNTTAEWDAEVAPVAASVPVVIGEFGQTDGGSGYFSALMSWADAHGVGYLPWAWWDVPVSESLENSRYALYEGAAFTPKAPIGRVFHEHLAALTPPDSNSCRPTRSRISKESGGNVERYAVLTTSGELEVKEGSAYAGWLMQSDSVKQASFSRNRIAVTTVEGRALLKQGPISSSFIELSPSGVVDVAVDGDRIVLLCADRRVYARDGVETEWVMETDNAVQIEAAQGRIGVRRSDGSVMVKEGSLYAGWVDEGTARTFTLDGQRLGLISEDHVLTVKEGSLYAGWVTEAWNVSSAVLSGTRVGVLYSSGDLDVKEGSLYAGWVRENSGVRTFDLTDEQLVIGLADGQGLLKTSSLWASWLLEHTATGTILLSRQ